MTNPKPEGTAEWIRKLADDLCVELQPQVERSESIIQSALLAAIAREREGKWVKCEERLPDYDTDVHLWAAGWKRVHVGYWRHSHEWIGRCSPEEGIESLPDTDPTYWCPLPSPPEVKE
jgi:hypothetical protein